MPQLVINYTAPAGVRVIAALGKLRQLKDGVGNPRDATVAEVQAEIINFLQGIVRTVEMQTAHDAAVAGVGDVPLN